MALQLMMAGALVCCAARRNASSSLAEPSHDVDSGEQILSSVVENLGLTDKAAWFSDFEVGADIAVVEKLSQTRGWSCVEKGERALWICEHESLRYMSAVLLFEEGRLESVEVPFDRNSGDDAFICGSLGRLRSLLVARFGEPGHEAGELCETREVTSGIDECLGWDRKGARLEVMAGRSVDGLRTVYLRVGISLVADEVPPICMPVPK